MNYKIIEFRMIDVSSLEKHPDAQAWPSDDDDRAGLDASIACVGVLEPLTVIEEAGGIFVIDGCGRLDDALAQGVEALPCLVVECEDVRNFAAHKNAMGRKRSTGSRILCYLMANQKIVLKTAEITRGTPVRSRDTTGQVSAEIPTELRPWTSREIAKRLRVSNKDVVAAIQLLVCQVGGCDPEGAEADAEGRDLLEKIFRAVVSANTPVRRWRAAYGGKRVPATSSGKAATNYPALGIRALTSLQTVFAHWHEMKAVQRELLVETLGLLLEGSPEEVRVTLSGVVDKMLADGTAKRSKGRI